jgi:hypothetical protein
LTLGYRGILFANTRGWWSPLGEDMYALMESLDPSVFGVFVSCLIFAGLIMFSNAQRKPGT